MLALAVLPLPDVDRTALGWIGAADLAVAATTWFLPWERWSPRWTLVLFPVAFAIVAAAQVIDPNPYVHTAFFALAFAWIGLHHPRWTSVWLALPAVVAFEVPLFLIGAPASDRVAVVVVVPLAVALGEVVAAVVARLRGQQEHLEQVDQWRADLIAVLAHDVRSPLTAVEGGLELLRHRRHELTDEQSDSLIAAALRQTARIKSLATDLLELGRIEEGKLRLELSRVRVIEVVEDALSYLDAGGLRVSVPDDLEITVDRARLEQIVINLVANALRHGEPPVEVGVTRNGPNLLLSVVDHGGGVPPAVRPHLFERFSLPGRRTGSVGLGLWIVRLLAEAHGGAVHYLGDDPGARFAVTLPIEPPARLARSEQIDVSSPPTVVG